jgi:hypothetical protein
VHFISPREELALLEKAGLSLKVARDMDGVTRSAETLMRKKKRRRKKKLDLMSGTRRPHSKPFKVARDMDEVTRSAGTPWVPCWSIRGHQCGGLRRLDGVRKDHFGGRDVPCYNSGRDGHDRPRLCSLRFWKIRSNGFR